MQSPMTAKGERALRDELQRLKTEIRPAISKDIATARAHGDLKENGEYHAAREQQGLTEARIRQIEADLADARIIDVHKIKPNGKVIFGTTVRLKQTPGNNDLTYQIVGKDEADLDQGKLSVLSPLARALIGKTKGELAEIETPKGIIKYEIQNIEHI